MSDIHLCRDGIREREMQSQGVYGHVHSNSEYVTLTLDTWTFEYMRRKMAGTVGARATPRPVHIMKDVDVTLSVE